MTPIFCVKRLFYLKRLRYLGALLEHAERLVRERPPEVRVRVLVVHLEHAREIHNGLLTAADLISNREQ